MMMRQFWSYSHILDKTIQILALILRLGGREYYVREVVITTCTITS